MAPPPGISPTLEVLHDHNALTTDVAVVEPQFPDGERYALAAFLAGHRGLTGDAYALDLRRFVARCDEHDLRLFAVRRADIECFARDLEARGRARAAVARRLCTVADCDLCAEQEGLFERSTAACPPAPLRLRVAGRRREGNAAECDPALLIAAALLALTRPTTAGQLAQVPRRHLRQNRRRAVISS